MHAKMIVSDDTNALIGSINMDFRSFFLHDECAFWLCGCSAVGEIKQDMLNCLRVSTEIKLDAWNKRPILFRIAQSILKLFAPLM
jgi:cardiolipin synthase